MPLSIPFLECFHSYVISYVISYADQSSSMGPLPFITASVCDRLIPLPWFLLGSELLTIFCHLISGQHGLTFHTSFHLVFFFAGGPLAVTDANLVLGRLLPE